HCQAPLGHQGPIQVLLRNSPGATAHLEFPGTPPRTKLLRIDGDYVWELTPPPGSPQPYTFKLHARMPLKDLNHFSMPAVTVGAARRLDRWLAITGTELRPKKMHGLIEAQDAAEELASWPGQAQRLLSEGTLWHVTE